MKPVACKVAFAIIRREMNSTRKALAAALYQTGVAYFVALLIYQTGMFVMRFL